MKDLFIGYTFSASGLSLQGDRSADGCLGSTSAGAHRGDPPTDARPVVLVIGGLDQSGGAGLLSDVKTFETHSVYAYGVCTALTFQNERIITRVQWMSEKDIFSQIDLCCESAHFDWVKIGVTRSMAMTASIIRHLHRHNAGIRVVLDPVIRASSGKVFWVEEMGDDPDSVMDRIWLLTPNWEEIGWLYPGQDPLVSCERLSSHCNIYLKGGHNPSAPGRDYLWHDGKLKELEPGSHLDRGGGLIYPKHGSGCVLASSLTANLALGHELPIAAERAKRYIERFLSSNKTLLGWHQPLES